MILVDHQIREAVRSNYLGIENFIEDGIQPASYDLRIGAHLYSSTEREPDKGMERVGDTSRRISGEYDAAY